MSKQQIQMVKERIVNLVEGDEFFSLPNDIRPRIFLGLDGKRVIYKHPRLGYKSDNYQDLQSVYIVPIPMQAWAAVKKEHKTWKAAAAAMNMTYPTLRKMRDNGEFPQEFYSRYGFQISKRRKV